MNFKIIETEATYPDVLLYREISPEGKQVAVIAAFGTIDGEADQQIFEIINFDCGETSQRFISDFSLFSAQKWCRKNKITY